MHPTNRSMQRGMPFLSKFLQRRSLLVTPADHFRRPHGDEHASRCSVEKAYVLWCVAMECTLSDSTFVKTEFLMSTGGAAKRRELAARLDEHPGVWGLGRTSARCGPKSDETRNGKKKRAQRQQQWDISYVGRFCAKQTKMSTENCGSLDECASRNPHPMPQRLNSSCTHVSTIS